jgi:hypothetical protein
VDGHLTRHARLLVALLLLLLGVLLPRTGERAKATS